MKEQEDPKIAENMQVSQANPLNTPPRLLQEKLGHQVRKFKSKHILIKFYFD